MLWKFMLWKMWCFTLQSVGHTNHKLVSCRHSMEYSNAPKINWLVANFCILLDTSQIISYICILSMFIISNKHIYSLSLLLLGDNCY